MQKIWLTVLGDAYGFFLWEVWEVVGEPRFNSSLYTECRDRSLIVVTCTHYFTGERVTNALQYFADMLDVEVIHIP